MKPQRLGTHQQAKTRRHAMTFREGARIQRCAWARSRSRRWEKPLHAMARAQRAQNGVLCPIVTARVLSTSMMDLHYHRLRSM